MYRIAPKVPDSHGRAAISIRAAYASNDKRKERTTARNSQILPVAGTSKPEGSGSSMVGFVWWCALDASRQAIITTVLYCIISPIPYPALPAWILSQPAGHQAVCAEEGKHARMMGMEPDDDGRRSLCLEPRNMSIRKCHTQQCG